MKRLLIGGLLILSFLLTGCAGSLHPWYMKSVRLSPENDFNIRIVMDIKSHGEMTDAGFLIATNFTIQKTEDGKCLVTGYMRIRPDMDSIGPEMKEILWKANKHCYGGD
jgi:hypothetical protein